MQSSLLDFKINGKFEWYEYHPPYLINVTTLPCESWNTKNASEYNFIF